MSKIKKFGDSEKGIIKKFYIYPIIISTITLLSFFIGTYFLLEKFKNSYSAELKQNLIEKEKKLTKQHLIEVVNRIKYLRDQNNENLKKIIKKKINEAEMVLENISAANKSKDSLKKDFLTILKALSFFDGRGYYFVYDNSLKKMLLPLVNGANENFTDKNLYIDKVLKSPDGAFSFLNINKKAEQSDKKIIYAKYIPKLDLIIGTGELCNEIDNKLKKELLDKISHIRFPNNGYIWIHNSKHTLLMNPYRKNFIGNDDTELVDSKGTKIIQMFVKKARESKKGTFVEYYWKKPNTDKYEKKISYLKYLEQWDWIIGTGVYIDDLNKSVEIYKKAYHEKVTSLYTAIFVFLIFIIIGMVLFALKLSKNIKIKFELYSMFLKNYTEELEKDVEKRTKELNNLNHSLEEKIKQEVEKNRMQEVKLLEHSKLIQMGEMIENIAHQWRQPLNAISLRASHIKIQHSLNKLDNEKLDSSLDSIMNPTQHLSKTIDVFRDFAKEKKEKKQVVIQESIERSLDIINASFEYNHIELIKEINHDNPIKVTIFTGELSQVLINLLNNAKDAMKDSSVDKKWIKISLSKKDGFAVTCVEDNAGGIPEDILPKIFDPYFTTKHKSQGTGLGLYMSYKIVKEHFNGQLYAQNSKNGAKFYIKIPLDEPSK